MKFEEFETLWAAQQPAHVPTVDTAALKRNVIPELKRRSRMLGYEMACLIFGLLVYPVLSVANHNYWGARNVPLFWLNLPLQMALSVALLIYAVRRLQRHRARLKQGSASLQAFTAMSVANIKAEMQEYRVGLWLMPLLFSTSFLSGYVNNPVGYGWSRVALQAGLMLGLLIPMGLVLWRHYRVNLMPTLVQQKEILKQLS